MFCCPNKTEKTYKLDNSKKEQLVSQSNEMKKKNK